MAMPRMRTSAQVLAEIKKVDPETCVTLSYIKRVIHEEKIPVLCVGKKKLVNLDDFIEFLSKGEQKTEEVDPATYGKIRRVV